MESMIKKYAPYAAVILGVFLIVPLIFRNTAMNNLVPIVFYFIFPGTAIVCAAVYCSKYGLDFLFTLIAPIAYIPSMLLYYGGFHPKYIFTNIVLLAVYLSSGIFGLFLGDIVFGDKRKKREAEEKAEAEEYMLKVKRRDEQNKAQETDDSFDSDSDDDFDYSRYSSDIDRDFDSEIDDILSEFGH